MRTQPFLKLNNSKRAVLKQLNINSRDRFTDLQYSLDCHSVVLENNYLVNLPFQSGNQCALDSKMPRR